LPSCASGVTVPTSTEPKPSAPRASNQPDAGGDAERARKAQPERVDAQHRVRPAERPQQPEAVGQRQAARGERVGGLGRDAPQDDRVEQAVEHGRGRA
jgi:hypothetical protein